MIDEGSAFERLREHAPAHATMGFEHQDVEVGGQEPRGMEAGEAGTDDGYVTRARRTGIPIPCSSATVCQN